MVRHNPFNYCCRVYKHPPIYSAINRAIQFSFAQPKAPLNLCTSCHKGVPFLKMAASIFKLLFVTVLVQLGAATYYCGAPDPLSYGTISPQQRTYPIGATVEFSCNNGFVLVGQKWTVCVFNAKIGRPGWAHPTPVCKRKLKKLPCRKPK